MDGRLVRSKSWYINGQKKADENYKRGITPPTQDGLQITWYENGRMKIEKNYRNGKPDGNWTEWYEDGQKKVADNYVDGKQDGLQITWHKNGQKESTVSFKEGFEDGQPFYKWDENGVQKYSPFGRDLTIPPRYWTTQPLCSPISWSRCECYKCWVYNNKIKWSFPHSGIP